MTTTHTNTKNLDPEVLDFYLPREIAFFLKQDETSSLLKDDHDYYRKLNAIELSRWMAHGLREAMCLRLYNFEHMFLQFFAQPQEKQFISGKEIASAFDKMVEGLSAKLKKQLDAAEKRSPPFIPTIERVIRKLAQTDEHNKLYRFLICYQVGPFYDAANVRSLVGREGRFQPNRAMYRGGVETFCPPSMLSHVFHDDKNDAFLVSNIMKMFGQNSPFVKERLLSSITDPNDNACNANEATQLVIQGIPLGPSQYHALESPLMQKCLGEDPTFLQSEAGKIHLSLHGGGDSESGMGVGGSEDAMGGRQDSSSAPRQTNKFRDALASRDRTKKESVFEVLTMLRQDSKPQDNNSIGGSTDQLVTDADALNNHQSVFDGAPTDPTEHFEGGMMGKAESAVFDGNNNLDDEKSSKKSATASRVKIEDTDDQNEDSKMKVPYKNDLEYLEDQFQLLSREKAVVRQKYNLHEAEVAGKDAEQSGGGGDDEFDPYYGRPGGKPQMDKNKIESDLRKARTRLTIQTELCKSRLRVTSSSGSWYPRLEILTDALELNKFEKFVVVDLIKSIISPDRDIRHGAFGAGRRDLTISSLQEKLCSTLEERMASRKSFYKTSPLLREGIVSPSAHY